MPLSIRALPIVLLGLLIDASYIVPDACSPVSLICAGEGQSCMYDDTNEACSTSTSQCRVCQGKYLRCHAGYCVKTIGKLGGTCYDENNNIFGCGVGLECKSSICQDPTTYKVTKYIGRGDACDPNDDLCGSSLMCDFNNKCSWPVCKNNFGSACKGSITEELCVEAGCTWVDPQLNFQMDNSIRVYSCEVNEDCPYGDYCDNGKCLVAIPYGQRLGASCLGGSLGNDQCGFGLNCDLKNTLEPHTSYRAYVCKWNQGPFDRREGERCSGNDECGKGMLCSGRVCSRADSSHVGEGCQRNAECGRGLTCSCPVHGDSSGGRKRCIVSSTYGQHDLKLAKFTNSYVPLVKCVHQYKCKLSSCITFHCGDYEEDWQTNYPNWNAKNKCSRGPLTGAQAYKGLPVGGSIQGNTVSLTWSIAVIFSLYLVF